jgi:hypothetical protein
MGPAGRRFLKVELKRAGIGYKELAERLHRHGLEETETSITGKLARGALRHRSFWRVWRRWRWKGFGWRTYEEWFSGSG